MNKLAKKKLMNDLNNGVTFFMFITTLIIISVIDLCSIYGVIRLFPVIGLVLAVLFQYIWFIIAYSIIRISAKNTEHGRRK